MARKKIVETKVKPVPAEKPNIGIDTSNSFLTDVISAAEIGTLDLSSIDALNQSAQSREQSYELIDSMSQDDMIASALETYTEDTIQTNDKGQIIWIESDDAKILDYVSWLLDTLNIEKSLYQWVYSLVRYGDTYVRLYRYSDVEEDTLFKKPGKQSVNEDIKIHVNDKYDPYVPYVEMVNNPGEMFDLQRFGKTYGYIRTPINMVQQVQDEMYNYLTHYQMKQKDIQLFDATAFVHACLDNINQRQPETVDITTSDVDEKGNEVVQSYSVKRGQSVLYNSFRVWRELNLLEMSALMNRLTKSALVRVLNVEVGDMPKEQVQIYLQRLKEKIEQKSAIDTGKSMSEYTNPGPIENTIYIPSHGGQGAITATTIGGDFDPKSLVDLEYFRDKLCSGLRIPKQFLNLTDDSTGFNGGSALTLTSSRYGKTIKKLQKVVIQLVTDILNLFLLDRHFDNYINRFTVRMQEPVTQEEKDRRESSDNRIRYIGEMMQQLTDVEDKTVRLKIYKSLLGTAVNDPDVMMYLQDYITKLEEQEKSKNTSTDKNSNDASTNASEESASEEPSLEEPAAEEDKLPSLEAFDANADKTSINEKSANSEEDDSYLPDPDSLGLDLTQKSE